MGLDDIERADVGVLWDVALIAVQGGRGIGLGAFRMGFPPGSIGHALTAPRPSAGRGAL